MVLRREVVLIVVGVMGLVEVMGVALVSQGCCNKVYTTD